MKFRKTLQLISLSAISVCPTLAALITPPLVGIADFGLHDLYPAGLDPGLLGVPVAIAGGGSDTWTFTVQNLSTVRWDDFHVRIRGGLLAALVFFSGANPPRVTAGFGAPPPILFGVAAGNTMAHLSDADTPLSVAPGGSATFSVTIVNTAANQREYWLGIEPTTSVPEPGTLGAAIAAAVVFAACAIRRKHATS